MFKKIISLLLSIVISTNSHSQCKLLKNNYDLVFEENFDNITDIQQLSSRWQFVHDDPGYGWGDYIDTLTNVRTFGEYYKKEQLSILPGGILRLRANKVDGSDAIYSDWLKIYRYPKYKSGMIQLRNDLNTLPYDIANGYSGFLYGMFEIRMKLPPNTECFPAFWLIRAGYPTEIDIFEYGTDNRKISNSIIDWSKPKNQGQNCQNFYTKLTLNDLSADFHTITCVWTPVKVTFFFDNKEMRTVNLMQQQTYNYVPLSIIVNLAMNPWHNVSENHMDIDYIKVYKPKNLNYSNAYKNKKENMPYNIFENASGNIKSVSTAPNSIAPNKNNPNEIFYRGSDDYIYVATKGSINWNIKKLLYNDGAPVLAKGDIKYLNNIDVLIYVGANNRINFFGRSSSEPTGFYHWYITSNYNCYWCNNDDKISTSPGSLQTSNNGEIFFRGLDNKMHHFYFSNNQWYHEILNSSYNIGTTNDCVKGDIVIDPNTNNVFYKGYDNKLQIFYKNSNSIYSHGWVDNNWNSTSQNINSNSGSMAWSNILNGVLYSGIDNKLHLFSYNGGWSHQVIPYSYNNTGLGYFGADYIKNNICWNEFDNTINYIGFDGRMQHFAKEQSTGNWVHYWKDDNWNTDLFTSYNSLLPNYNSSIISSIDGSVIYTNKNGNLSYLKYDNCENLNPLCNDELHPKKLYKIPKSESLKSIYKLQVSPNPSKGKINININDFEGIFNVTIFDNTGSEFFKSKIENNQEIDVSYLKSGIFFVHVYCESFTIFEKLIIE
jgi:beta-glucanase (GH16 family)